MNCPKILVGLKSDLRDKMLADGQVSDAVCNSCGVWEAKQYKFAAYVECSAKMFENCGNVFGEAIRHAKRFENMKEEDKLRGRGAPDKCKCMLF